MEAVPFGHYFMDDPKVYTLPGSGFKVGAEPPPDCLHIAPLYSQTTIDTLRAQLEAAEAEAVNLRTANIAYSQQVNELIGRAENAERGIVKRDDDMVVPMALWEEMDRVGLEWKARAEAAEAECAALRGLLKQTAAVGITMLFDSHKDDVRAEFSTGELMEVVAVSEPLNTEGAQVEKVYRTAWDAARTKEQQA